MFTVFIVDDGSVPARTRFTETKIFFDAENQGITNWANDCCVIASADAAVAPGVIINSGDCITAEFRRQYPTVTTLIDARGHPDIVSFAGDYNFDIRKQPPWPRNSKQTYILENLYKTLLRSKKLVYFENTESTLIDDVSKVKHCRHFYGLASGWKSMSMLKDIGIDQFETITIFDRCSRQLEFQKDLHQSPTLPKSVTVSPPVFGKYFVPDWLDEFWGRWHQRQVNYVELDLFAVPTFPAQSLIWISNVFLYEPNIFEHGWQSCQDTRLLLHKQNSSSIIIEN